MGAVNRVTRGLLSLMDSQVQGDNPNDLSSSIIPTIQVEDFLRSSKGYDVVSTTTTVTTAPSSTVVTQVPSGETWQVACIALEFVALEALATTWFPAIYFTRSGNAIPLDAPSAGIGTGVAGYVGSFTHWFDRPMFFSGQEQIYGFMQKFTGTAPVLGVTFRSFIVYTRLTV